MISYQNPHSGEGRNNFTIWSFKLRGLLNTKRGGMRRYVRAGSVEIMCKCFIITDCTALEQGRYWETQVSVVLFFDTSLGLEQDSELLNYMQNDHVPVWSSLVCIVWPWTFVPRYLISIQNLPPNYKCVWFNWTGIQIDFSKELDDERLTMENGIPISALTIQICTDMIAAPT